MKIYTNDLVKGHSDFKVKCLTFGLYTQVSDSGPLGPLVLSVGSNLYASKYTSRELTQIKMLWLRLSSIGPLATGSNTNHVFFCHVYFHFVSSFCVAFLTISKIMVTKWLLQR